MKKPPSKRARYGLIAFFLVSALLFFAGAAYAWWDEHGGVAGQAHVTSCENVSVGSRHSVHCDATWIYRDHRATGYVENAKMNQEGKTISVRIHGTSHVTNTTYWVPIGLALFGLFELAVLVMIVRSFNRQTATGVPEPAPESPA